MLHYNPRHVSSINMSIFRRTNFIITASGIVTLCKRLERASNLRYTYNACTVVTGVHVTVNNIKGFTVDM